MNNKKQQVQVLLGLALMGGVMVATPVQAGGFSTPTYGAPGWGRAFGGGSLFKNDPSSAYNNPAAMAFVDQNVAQMTVDYARIKIKYKGAANDYLGNPVSNSPIGADGFPDLSSPTVNNNDGGEGGFTAWLPTGFMVMPLGDRFAFGLSQVVPQGMRSTWDEDSKLRDFAVDTRIETVGLTGSLSFKVNDQFAIGGGLIVQHSKGFVSQNIDLLAAAAHHSNVCELGHTLGHRLEQSRAFCTAGGGKGSVLHVAAGKNAAILGAQGSAHHKIAVGHIGFFPCSQCHADELLLFFQGQVCHIRHSFFGFQGSKTARQALLQANRAEMRF